MAFPQAQPTHMVRSLAELRALAEQVEPGARLLVEVDAGMPFDDLLQIWESITDEEGPIELYNIETVCGKKEGAEFVEYHTRGLERLRDDCAGRIGCLNNWVHLMEASLLEHAGPDIPFDHSAVLMLGHPPCFLDLLKIGTDGAGDKEGILSGSVDMPVKPATDDGPAFWTGPQVREHARIDKRSLIKFNISLLKLKIDVLRTMYDKLKKGIKGLQCQFQGRVYLGCSKEGCVNTRRRRKRTAPNITSGFRSFRDLPLVGHGA